MKKSPGVRRRAHVSAPLLHHLNLYAAGATAAGVGALAVAQSAEAKIVYTPADVNITNFHLDLNHDGVNDFLLQNNTHFVSQTLTNGLDVTPSSRQNRVWGEGHYASALHAGIRVGHGFPRGGKVMAYNVYTLNSISTKFHGPWANGGKGVKNRYLGLKFVVKGKAHFGWARLNVAVGPRGQITAKLTGYAYETIPNKSILTGKTKGPNGMAVQPATLGHLARGSSGVSGWRAQSSAP